MLRKPRPGILAAHLMITLAYPALKALRADSDRLLVFTDAMTIIALILLVCGVVYAMILRGDWDLSGFVVSRGLGGGNRKSFQAYQADRREEREDAFNYPLFLGIACLLAAGLINLLYY